MTQQSPAEAVFFAALQKGADEERVAYLDAACGDDDNLRQRVERLLAAHPQVGSFLQSPAQGEVGAAEAHTIPPDEICPAGPGLAETTSYHSPGEGVGSIIAGRYKLLETLGQGGMGAVFMAQQTQPVKRLVALKLIKLGMDSKQVLTRFEAERQALALMDHPNIARVLDAGATNSGRPFFVMELVKGVPITRFCDERQLSPRERLELFIPVCQAIQHAHQKGVIHRDIKPTNVLFSANPHSDPTPLRRLARKRMSLSRTASPKETSKKQSSGMRKSFSAAGLRWGLTMESPTEAWKTSLCATWHLAGWRMLCGSWKRS